MKVKIFLCAVFIGLLTVLESQAQTSVNITANIAISSDYGGGYTCNITFTPNVTLTTWVIVMNIPGSVSSWNVTSTNSGSQYTFTPPNSNSIQANSTYNFGFNVTNAAGLARVNNESIINATGNPASNPNVGVVLSAYWSNSGQNIYMNPIYTGNVGIGTPTPTAGLSVFNNTAATLNLQQGSNSPFWISSKANGMQIGGTGTTYPTTGAINIDNGGNVTIPKNTFLNGIVTMPQLSTGIVHSTGGLLSSSAINLSNDVMGVISIANGGTNNASLAVTNGGIIYADGSRLQSTATGATGQVLNSNGDGVPTWTTPISREDANYNIFTGSVAGNSNITGINNIFTGGFVGYLNTSGSNNIFTGSYAGFNNTTGSENIILGNQAGNSNTEGSNNVFTGYGSGLLNTKGGENIFIGYLSGLSNTEGNNNVFTGFESGLKNTKGGENIFSGDQSGFSNTEGNNNVFIGFESGLNNTLGGENIFSGYLAGSSNTKGSNNVFTGFESGLNNTTGNDNIFNGYMAGSSNTIGSGNIYIGTNSGFSNTGNNNLFIGNSAGLNVSGDNKLLLGNLVTGNGAPSLLYGDFSTNQLAIGTTTFATGATLTVNGSITNTGVANVGSLSCSGTANTGSLTVNGSINIPSFTSAGIIHNSATGILSSSAVGLTSADVSGVLPIANGGTNNGTLAVTNGGIIYTDGIRLQTSAAGTVGQVLTSNGTGTPLWTSPITTSDGINLYTGTNALNNTTGSFNTYTGIDAGSSNTKGFENTFTGFYAGIANTEGLDNTFIGAFAGASNTIGTNNVFNGSASGINNTEGGENTFTGYGAGSGGSDAKGSNNVFNGYLSGASNTKGGENIFTGYLSGYYNTTGKNNVFNGSFAGLYNNSTNDNTYIGYSAGKLNTGGSNVFIGSMAGSNETTLSNKYILGTSASAPYLMYGSFETNQIGIGTNSLTPGYALNVAGGILLNPPADGSYTPTLQVNGNATIGTQGASNTLTVNGTTNLLGSLNANGTIGTAGQILTINGDGVPYWTSPIPPTCISLWNRDEATKTLSPTTTNDNLTLDGTIMLKPVNGYGGQLTLSNSEISLLENNDPHALLNTETSIKVGMAGLTVSTIFPNAGSSVNINPLGNIKVLGLNPDYNCISVGYNDDQNQFTVSSSGDVVSNSLTVNGKTGIGCLPQTNYMLAVNGAIAATKVTVEQPENGSFPDYVLKKDYKLPTLNEVEQYINTNSHLPEVPSAEEVCKNGIDVAQMDATLLKKVEELTLYIIDQNKRMTELEKQNAELMKALKK